ncbi:MAG: hypothetical protein LQ350_005155 [Teloschistes chrysophthalmus]|nr:MAG: hypothetical protein LQ350_005155 [Niorma chrysophthalma]
MAGTTLAKLVQILDDHESIGSLLSISVPLLSPSQTDDLQKLAHHFASINQQSKSKTPDLARGRKRSRALQSRSPKRDGSSGSSPSSHGKKLSRRTSTMSQRSPLSALPRREWPTEHPWDGVLRIDSLTLAPAVEYHLAEHGTDPAPFLDDRNVLWNMSFVSYEDNFTANFDWTAALEWRMTRDRLRWCFTTMMYFDLSKFLKPRRSCQLDARMVDRMRETLHITLETTWDRNDLFEREAFGYLEKLDLRQKAEDSGANELARNIRQYLIEPFKNQMAVEE